MTPFSLVWNCPGCHRWSHSGSLSCFPFWLKVEVRVGTHQGESNISTLQIFPSKAMEKMKGCVQTRNELLNEILEKCQVGDGAEEMTSQVESGRRAG